MQTLNPESIAASIAKIGAGRPTSQFSMTGTRDQPRSAARPREQASGIDAPLVSVVIPTRNRPQLVERAARSALSQTLREIEVVVVVDGPDSETRRTLEAIGDHRLHILCLRQTWGGSEARNIGVRYARGAWIALLDDDDEWLPEKLAKQWEIGQSMSGGYLFVASRFVERTDNAERVLPRRLPALGEAFSEYLFARRGWHSGEGFLQTSTWFATRALLTRVPFTRGLKRCQDLDWLLRATALPETEVRVAAEVLAIFHHDEHRERVSRTPDWRFLYDWALANRRFFTPRAYSFFLATFCVPSAAKERAGAGTFLFLLRCCVFRGRPGGKCLLLFLLCWWLPEARRRSLRAGLESARQAAPRRLAAIFNQPLPGKAVL
jgi:glycosyltransferase involved in cell wall biosynthesis